MARVINASGKILDSAEKYIRTLGVNGFSYADIELEVGIKTASIHYHFPSKQNLILNVLKRYLEKYKLTLIEIDQSAYSSIKKLRMLGDLFGTSVKENKFCLCGVLLSDIRSISDETKVYIEEFFSINQTWIKKIIKNGVKKGEIKSSVKLNKFAINYLATLEGATLIARIEGYKYLMAIVDEMLSRLTA